MGDIADNQLPNYVLISTAYTPDLYGHVVPPHTFGTHDDNNYRRRHH